MDNNSWLIRLAQWTPRWMIYVVMALAVLATIGIWVMLFLSKSEGWGMMVLGYLWTSIIRIRWCATGLEDLTTDGKWDADGCRYILRAISVETWWCEKGYMMSRSILRQIQICWCDTCTKLIWRSSIWKGKSSGCGWVACQRTVRNVDWCGMRTFGSILLTVSVL